MPNRSATSSAPRDVALKAKFPPETLARADDLAKRGEAALKNDPKAAARYFRDARWHSPICPPGCRIMSSASSANRGCGTPIA